MKILLAAPEIYRPWTEGRKRFVRDLASALADTHRVHIVTTAADGLITDLPTTASVAAAGTPLAHLTALHRALRRALAVDRPDLVCHFPYGTFRHVYGLANLWAMHRVDRHCEAAGVPCFTMMYSISSEAAVHRLRPWVRHLVLNNLCDTQAEHAVRLGIDFRGWPEPAPRAALPAEPRLLFMAGMWQPTARRLEHVMRVRGLALLLRAGAGLAAHGLRLTVAVPLLAESSLREALRRHPDNTWPAERLTLHGETTVPEVYRDHNLFVFPYAREETQFTPTSVVEAMCAGMPVVLPTLAFLRPLAGGNHYAFTYPPNDVRALTDTVLAAVGDRERYDAVRRAALAYARETMSIQRSCDDLMALYRHVTSEG